ncbi:MAG: T9SS type A sorting domain-containing protein, partial [Bacteroidales bacterium]
NAVPETPEIYQVGENLVSSSETGNQWYDDNGMITGATGQIYSPSVTGNYYTIVTNEYGCESEMSNVIYFQPTFINELVRDGSFRIYPNPAKDIVTIDFIADNTNEVHITLHNAFGQKLHEIVHKNQNRSVVNSVRFDMSTLQGGVYYFKLQNENQTATRKIILSK